MSEKTKEYEIGKRHLAKMMGLDEMLTEKNKKFPEKNKNRFDLNTVEV